MMGLLYKDYLHGYRIKMKKSTVAVMMMATLSGGASADSGRFTPNFSADSFTVSTSAGMLSGKSHEMVYDTETGRKVS